MASDPTQAAEAQSGSEIEFDDFSSLLEKQFKPKDDSAKDTISKAVGTLAQQALADASRVSDDVYSTVDAMVAELDRKMSEQMNAILHHPEFQKLESAWRGLNYMVMNSETGKDLKIRVLNVERKELEAMFKAYGGAAWDQSADHSASGRAHASNHGYAEPCFT